MHPDHVDVLITFGHHLLPLHRCGHRFETVTQTCRPLKIKFGRRGTHVGVQPIQHVIGVTIEESTQVIHHRRVLLRGHLAHTRPCTLLDVKQQTWATQAFMLAILPRRTGADRERPEKQIKSVADGIGMGVRTEVANPRSPTPAGHECARPFFIDGHRQKWITLVVT